MCSCLRQTLCLPKFFKSSRTSSLKYFSSISPVPNKRSSSYDPNNLIKKTINPVIQHRNFSFVQNIQSFYDYVNSSEASKITRQALMNIHDYTGIPWFGTIIASCAIMKLLVALPCGIFQQHLVSKLELTKIELNGKVPGIKQNLFGQAVKGKWTKQKLQIELHREVQKEWKSLVVKNNCHPFKAIILFFLQFPFWLVLTLTIRKLAYDVQNNKLDNLMSTLQFQVGGPFWCKNLAEPDSTFILPAINFLALMAVTELALVSKMSGQIPQRGMAFIISRTLPFIQRLLAVAFFLISAVSPSVGYLIGLSLFWASSSILALSQNLLLMSPRVKRLLRIPKTPSDYDQPYRGAWNSFMEKWSKFFSRKK